MWRCPVKTKGGATLWFGLAKGVLVRAWFGYHDIKIAGMQELEKRLEAYGIGVTIRKFVLKGIEGFRGNGFK